MFLTIIAFILILGLLIFAHEFGHFITAKKMGVRVDEFGFGFPPRIFGWKKINGKRKFFWGNKKTKSEDTIYSLNWIPIGGFVKIKGEAGERREDPDSFAHKKIWQRGIILSAGVLMNIFLCFILLSVGFSLGLPQMLEEDISSLAQVKNRQIQIVSILENSPAQKAKLKSGDAILKIDDKKIDNIKDIQKYIGQREGKDISITIKRGDKKIQKTITPKIIKKGGQAKIGVGLVETGIVSYPWYLAIWQGLKTTIFLIWQMILALYTIIKNLILRSGVSLEIAGPVGIAVITGQVVNLGFIYVLQFVALLSLNLAIINFLPFPALDGGRILFLVIEKIRGKAVDQRIENLIHNIGFSLLIILIIFITYHDIVKFGGEILGKIKGVWGG